MTRSDQNTIQLIYSGKDHDDCIFSPSSGNEIIDGYVPNFTLITFEVFQVLGEMLE